MWSSIPQPNWSISCILPTHVEDQWNKRKGRWWVDKWSYEALAIKGCLFYSSRSGTEGE